MKRLVKYSILLTFILAGCASFLYTKSEDIFVRRALRRVSGEYPAEWLMRHTFLPYTAEMMRIYLKSRGYKVPDTTWFNYYYGKKWVLSHKSMFKDTLFMQEMLNIFTEIGRSTGIIITDRIERGKFEWEIDLGDTTIYWYAEPRKIMAVFTREVVYFTGPFCREGRNRRRILIAFPSSLSGCINPFNSPYRGKEEDADSVLVFFYEGRWDRGHLKYLLSQEPMGPDANPILCQFIERDCIRYMTGMYFLKNGRWYFAYPFSRRLYEHPTDAIGWDVEEDPSFYMWGKTRKDYRMYYRPPFSDTLFRDIIKFVEKHAGDVIRSGR